LTEFERSRFRPIDRSSPVPYYYQLQEILKEEIEASRWAPGDLLPSEAELSTIFGISRTVIRNALDVLEADGQVFRMKGKGTVVAQPKFRYQAAVPHAGAIPYPLDAPRLSRLVDVRPVTVGGQVGRLLELDPAQTVVQLTFVHAFGAMAASLSQMFLRTDASEALGEELPRLEEGGPDVLFQLAERYQVEVDQSDLTVEATRANLFEAEMLGVRHNAPMYLLASVERGADGQPLAFTRTVVRSDHFRFSMVLRRDPNVEAASLPFMAPATTEDLDEWS
jgi:GntR family transcriptional regulator